MLSDPMTWTNIEPKIRSKKKNILSIVQIILLLKDWTENKERKKKTIALRVYDLLERHWASPLKIKQNNKIILFVFQKNEITKYNLKCYHVLWMMFLVAFTLIITIASSSSSSSPFTGFCFIFCKFFTFEWMTLKL